MEPASTVTTITVTKTLPNLVLLLKTVPAAPSALATGSGVIANIATLALPGVELLRSIVHVVDGLAYYLDNDEEPNDRKDQQQQKKAGNMSGNGHDSNSDARNSNGSGRDERGQNRTTGSEQQQEKEEKKEPSKRCISCPAYDDSFSSESVEDLFDELPLNRSSVTILGTLTGSYHLVRRLTGVIRTGGMASFLEAVKNISRFQIFLAGRSLTKDCVCSIEGHHASHAVRLQIDPRVTNPVIIQILNTYLAHTHCVHLNFNVHIGRRIDTLQGELLNELVSIDWNAENADDLSEAAKTVLEYVKAKYLDLLYAELESKDYSADQIEEIDKAIEFIREMSVDDLFEKIQNGFKYMKREMEKYDDK